MSAPFGLDGLGFQQPWALLALLALPLVWFAQRVGAASRRRADEAYGGSEALRLGRSLGRRRRREWLLLGGLALLALAFARPTWGTENRAVSRQGIDVAIALDVSRSMTATDLEPTRAEAAAEALGDMLRAMRGDRVGLVTFGGSAFPRSPLSLDLEVIGQLVAQAQSEALLVRPGSDLAAALEEAITLLSIEDRAESQVIVLVSDGEHEGRALEFAIRRASDAGIPVFTVGAGTEEGAAIPSDSEGATTESTRLERDVLERIAAETGGSYRSVEEAPGLAVEFARLRSSELATGERAAPVDRFRWFVAGAVVLLALQALLGETAGSSLRPRRPRRLALGGAAASVLLITACSGTVAYEHVRSGNEAHLEGRYEDALTEYQVAASAEPENPAVPYNTGNTLHELERYEEAQVASEQAAMTATEERLFIDATYALGNTAVRRGDLEAARTHYREVLLRDPADEDARHNLELVMLTLQEQQPPEEQPADQGDRPGGGDGQGPQGDGGTEPGATPGPGEGGEPAAEPTPTDGGEGGSGTPGGTPPPGPGDGPPRPGEPGGEGGSQDGQPGAPLSPEELQAQLEQALAGLDREVTLDEALQILELLRQRNALDSLGQEPDRGPLPAR